MPDARAPRRAPSSVTAGLAAVFAVVAAPVLLVAAALAGAGSGVLIAICVLASATLGTLSAAARSAVTGALAAAFGVAAVLAAAGVALGGHVDTSGRTGHPFPVVIGLRLGRAEALFRRDGPVRFVVTKAEYGQRGIVLRATGYAADGTYDAGATISLLVGSQAPPHHAH